MPGATSTPYLDLVEDGRLKSPDQLRAFFAEKKIDLQRPITTTCGSGVTAAVVSLALEIAGAKDVTRSTTAHGPSTPSTQTPSSKKRSPSFRKRHILRSRARSISMPTTHTRITVIGCGHVGTSCAFAILQNRLAREIVLIGDTEHHVQGEALDLQQAVPLGSPIKIFAGTYKDAAASSVVIITVGTPGKFQGSRLDMLAGNVVIVTSCVNKLLAEGFDGIVIIATNPVDVLTYTSSRKDSGSSSRQSHRLRHTPRHRTPSPTSSASTSTSIRAPSTPRSSAC